MTASPADSFVNSIGVNVHLGYPGTPYATNLPLVEQRLTELGVRHVRGELYPKAPDEYQAIHELAARGIQSEMILGDPAEPEAALTEMLAAMKTPNLAGAIDTVEGPNEYSTRGGTEWVAKLRAYQERLWNGINGDPALAAIPVLGPSIVHGDQQKLGDLSAFLDDGNIHSYPQGSEPKNKLEYFMREAKYNSGSAPLFATETGYENATSGPPAGAGENKPVSEEASAVYMPRLFFEYWTRGIVRTFSYELLDDHANSELTEPEDHYGLLRNDLSEKPAFVALQNTIAILADPGDAFTPGSLQYSLSVGGATLRSTLLQRRDGSFYLALWRLESVWNPETRVKETAPVTPETITLPAGLSSYSVYEPDVSSNPVATGGATTAVTVNVGAPLTIVRMVPAVPAPPIEPPPSEPPPSEPPAGPPAEPAALAQTPFLVPSFSPPIFLPAADTPRCLVPKLTGRRLAAARRAVRRFDCALGAVTTTSGSGSPVPANATVIVQRPRAGASLSAGAKIAVTLRR